MKTTLIAVCWLLSVYSAAAVKHASYDSGSPQTEAAAAVAAEITAETRLGPTAGNGTHPFATAVDTRRKRLWVLNQIPQSLSVVDLATRRVIGFVALPHPKVPEFNGWGNSEPHIWMGYDPKTDRVLVGAGCVAVRSVIVSIDAGRIRIVAVRTFKDCLAYRWAINAKRGEVVVAEMGTAYRGGFGLLIMDAKTLETHADLASRQTEAMAASEQTGRLYTVEPSNPPGSSGGMGGPFSSTWVIVRNPASGATVSQCPGDYAYPQALFVDDASHRLYLVHRSYEPNVISIESTTVTVFSQSTLRRERTIHYADPNPYGRHFLFWSKSYLDAPRHRLVVDLDLGALGILNLLGPPKQIRIPVEGSLYSDYRLVGVVKDTGQPLVLMDNAVHLLNAATLKSGSSITLGATIQDLFLDGKRNRLLAHVDRGIHEFLMLENSLPRRLFKSYLLPQTHLLNVDFDREAIYSVYADSWGNAASLGVMNFRGERAKGGYRAEGEFSALISTDTPGRSIRLLAPGSESQFALRRCTLDLLDQGHEVKSVALPQLSAIIRPLQLLYAAQIHRVYVVFRQTMTVYAGSDLAEINTVSLAALSKDQPYRALPGMLAVEPAGAYAYYADPIHNQITKMRLADGSIVTSRQLTFAPTSPLVDAAADRLYLADNNGGRVVAIRLF